jgi:hypothetical protein
VLQSRYESRKFKNLFIFWLLAEKTVVRIWQLYIFSSKSGKWDKMTKNICQKKKTPVADVPYIGLQIMYTTNSLFM